MIIKKIKNRWFGKVREVYFEGKIINIISPNSKDCKILIDGKNIAPHATYIKIERNGGDEIWKITIKTVNY